jgi:UDP-glucose:(heptosyl)LPS alpha-1,3-glucosyltransferase
MSSRSSQSGIGHELTIGFVRRCFSSGGGAEAYLGRLAAGVATQGFATTLYTSGEWPAEEWKFGRIEQVGGSSATAFADALAQTTRPASEVLFSLERVWGCDVYRAGDGVHRGWLERRNEFAGAFQKLSRLLNRKHSATLALEESLFAKQGAKRTITNSRMVKDEIVKHYGYPSDSIEVVYNGVPLEAFSRSAQDRAATRGHLGLGDSDIAVLFAGSGWERKGLRFAIEAIERQDKAVRFLVAGRGEPRQFGPSRAQFLGVVREMASLYHAADIFLLPTLYDPFSNACLEALAAGKPVITTGANGFSEIIEDRRHGTIVQNPSDVAAISDALKFWSDADRRAEARVENLALAAQFDISRNVDETLRILSRRD